MEKRKRFVPRFVLYITSLLSDERSNRAAVASNCSSLLPGAPRVQSRIHEFLVHSPPLRSFFTYVSTSAFTRLPRCYLVPHLLCTVCARRISHTRAEPATERNRTTSIEMRTRIIENAKCVAFIPSMSRRDRYSYCLYTGQL